MKAEDAPVPKKAKLEKLDEEEEKENEKLKDLIKTQTKQLYTFRDQVKDQMKKKDMFELLERNGQDPVQGDSEKLLDQVADLLTFGALLPCPVCEGRQLLFHKSGYLCNGNISEWAKCTHLMKEPERKVCKIPSDLKDHFKFLKKVKKSTETRAVKYVPPSTTTLSKHVKKDDELDG